MEVCMDQVICLLEKKLALTAVLEISETSHLISVPVLTAALGAGGQLITIRHVWSWVKL